MAAAKPRKMTTPGQGSKVDWAYAGSDAGTSQPTFIPSREIDVRTHGAKIDGVTDDRAALQQAIYNVQINGGGVVVLPPGNILIEGKLQITSSNVVLRGAGSEKTTLYVPHSLKYYDELQGW